MKNQNCGILPAAGMFDSHAHVAFSLFDADREEVIARLQPASVTGWIEVGTDQEQSRWAVALAEQYVNCWATVGVHPDNVAELNEAVWQELTQLIMRKKVVAVGEVGFDFFREGKREVQELVLRQFVELAQRVKKPIVFHVRDGEASAHNAMLEFLRNYSDSERPRGVIHTFSGNEEQAKQYLELGMHLSFSGVITFPKKAEVIQEVARTAPPDRILIETDCPFLTPEPFRGQRNEPSYVRFVAEKLAQLRGVTLAEIDRVTEKNTKRLFDI